MVINDERQASFNKGNARRSQFAELLRKQSMTLPKQTKEIKKDQALKLPVFDDEQVQELFKARCKDLKIPVKLK